MRIFEDLAQKDLEENYRFAHALQKWLNGYADYSDDNEQLCDMITELTEQYGSLSSELWSEISDREQDAKDAIIGCRIEEQAE